MRCVLRQTKTKLYVSTVLYRNRTQVTLLYSPIRSHAYVFHGAELATEFLDQHKLHGELVIVYLEANRESKHSPTDH